MCLLHIHAKSYSRNFEVLTDQVESAELIAEDAVSLVLLDLFGEATVNDVAILFSPASHLGLRDCSIQIEALCPYQSFKLLPCSNEYIELTVGKSLSTLLKQLFGPVTIESVIVQRLFVESL